MLRYGIADVEILKCYDRTTVVREVKLSESSALLIICLLGLDRMNKFLKIKVLNFYCDTALFQSLSPFK